ncbi:DUF4254 domain-containing protein [Streptomyces lydicus]|uniref:DUF4254 domain-containing protein n=1 Tax=Streptomyces lydicus TaxID=47763 RepID=UPI0036F0E2C9
MTNTPARLGLDTGEFGQDPRAAVIAGASCLDMAGGQRGWCEDALAGMPFPCSPELLKPLDRLHAVNSRQWDAEDRVRQAEDCEIPAIKREIDELNSLRHVLIEQVDRILGTAWDGNENVPPLTESIGSALDRLSVLTLRIVHAERLVGGGAGAVERVAILRRQRDDLVWSIAVACEDLVSGRRRTPRPERMKLYGKSRR